MSPRIYLDNNASTFTDPRVIDYLIGVMPTIMGNPSSSHAFGQKVRGLLTQARTTMAAYLKVKPQELIITSGGTEGANLLLRGLMDLNGQGHMITSRAEHSCVYAAAKYMERRGYQISFLEPGEWGAVTPAAVRSAIRENTKLICLMAVNNETGVKTDVAAIAQIAEEHSIPFFVDAVSLLGKEVVDIPAGVSAMFFSGHKFHAPQGVGLCFIRSGLKLQPLMLGGEHEYGRRAGTENVTGALALAKAIELLQTELPQATAKMLTLRDRFENSIQSALNDVFINGQGPRICNVSNLAFAGVDGEAMLMALDVAGVAASHGSACASGALEPSRILLGMGLSLERVNASIRFSLSRMTTEDEIDRAVSIIVPLVNRLHTC